MRRSANVPTLAALAVVAGAVAAAACASGGAGGGRAGSHAPRAPAVARSGVHGPLEVIGNRGARAVLPAGTLAGYAHALAAGVDTLEVDVAVSKDDRVIVTSDLELDEEHCLLSDRARPGPPRPVRTMTLSDLKRYDCGTLPDSHFPRQVAAPGARIATLAEVFDLVDRSPLASARSVTFEVTLRSLPSRPELTPAPDTFAGLVLAVADAHHARSRVTLASFDHRLLRAAERLAPEVPRAALVDEDLPDLVAVAASAHAGIVGPAANWVTIEEVRALHDHGVRVVPWAASSPAEWGYLVGIGVDGVVTDDPAALVAYLHERGLR